MTRTIAAVVVAISIILISAAIPALAQESQPEPTLPDGNNCTNGEIIDGSTAADAKAKFEAAGYSDVVILSKGCDNFWHGTAVKNGVPGNVVLSPDGTVTQEGQ